VAKRLAMLDIFYFY